MPVPCFFTHCGGNQHVSFTLDLWWWPGRKLTGRTPAWKINCAHLVSASGEILHLELENGGSFTSFLPSSNTCCQYFSCSSSAWAGMMWVNVLMWLCFCGNIYTHICVCGCIFCGISGALWADELCCKWEQKHFCQPLFGRRDIVDLCWTSFTDYNFIATRTIISKSALPVAACSRCTLKYWGLFWVGITLL